MAIHIILMIGLPELNKPLLIPQEMSVTISSSPIQKPIEKIETPEPVKKVEPIQKKITPIIDKNAISVVQPTPKEVAPAPPAETISKIPNIVPQEQLTQHLESYSSLLANAIAKYKQYPKIAQMRGWQGTVIADLEIDSKGTVISIKIKKSSTYEVLDNEALEMIRKASPFPAPPESLRGKNFNVLVPISFKLE
ncbi:energy transducer TonB [Candidatus Methylopumilus universalis]|uniref:Energy transducer TonB n=2 Tax=Candidatus Methylopumilus universalis TaxID=2588536 RepID=A0AAX1F169_9PROT|nr:energy transducer TonB [Candidatus Methylopumilus universalis]QDC43003.1 energy transducer TonB [Candidatus Methylopumilus universalis]QDC55392.1 energy transducer TonB [Candidatus Methylopumilus universalis]QDC56673.1 energy transducer TonB [Candidatus Methylopumilus universalis]QDC57963.1 energy transducer TonB [Candidatus Methylopumilus universalis]